VIHDADEALVDVSEKGRCSVVWSGCHSPMQRSWEAVEVV